MVTRYNNRYNKKSESPSTGLWVKLIVAIVLFVICIGIALYQNSVQVSFKVEEIHLAGDMSSITIDFERKTPWLKIIVDMAGEDNSDKKDLNIFGININELENKEFKYVIKEKDGLQLIEIHDRSTDDKVMKESIKINLGKDNNYICLKQNGGGYGLIARKNEATGNWERVNFIESFIFELKHPQLF